jgi:hypothetical protein
LLSLILWFSLVLNQEYEVDTKIPIKIFVSKPLAVSGNVPLFLDAKIRGKGWDLMRVFMPFRLEFTYSLPDRKDTFNINTRNYLLTTSGLGSKLTFTDIYPENISLRTENYEEKYVKLIPDIVVLCKEGYQVVGKYILEPDSIKIGGAVDILKNINALSTKHETFEDIYSPVFRTVQVSDTLSNIIWKSSDFVKLTVNVELSAEREFNDINIGVVNLPEDKEVMFIPQLISVRLRGGVNQLAKLESKSIIANVDFQQILADTTGSVSPEFILPESAEIILYRPEQIQYVIKKK